MKSNLLQFAMKYSFILALAFFIVLIGFVSEIAAQNTCSFSGKVAELKSGKPVELVTVVLKEVNKWSTTNAKGEFYINKIDPGKYSLYISCLGYKTIEREIIIQKDVIAYLVKLEVFSLGLDEVTVIAEEGELGSVSKIGQAAIQHIQPRSIKDVFQLLPGHITENPSLKNPGQIRIREVGYANPSGAQIITNPDDPTSALGAAIIVDGAPVSNNANLQVFSTAKSGTSTEIPSVAGKGIDLREFTTENIESIEVIRGIPSVEYGDLTSGAVIVKTKSGKTPYETKVSIDPNTKMFSFGKGFLVGDTKGAVNTSIDYTSYYPDITKKYTGYKRITANMGYSNTFYRNSKPLSFNLKFAYHRTIDDEKSDAQLKSQEVIKSKTNGIRLGAYGEWNVNNKWITNLKYNFSLGYSHQDDYQKELHTLTAGTMPLATSYEEGEHAADFLPSEYYSELTIDGKPFNVFGQVKGYRSVKTGEVSNNLMFGVEWRANGNNGNGKEYDINFPPTINSISTIRPRSYKDIPTLNTISLFAENKIKVPFGFTMFTCQAGLRFSNTQPTGLFRTDGTLTLEPRVNLKYQLLNAQNSKFFKNLSLRAGYGITAKAPTLVHLYPDKAYFDETSLNYKDEKNSSGSLAVITTKIIEDTSNPDLDPAYNEKMEFGFDFAFGQVKGVVTGYYEKQTGGFNYKSVPIYLKHREYEVNGGSKFPYFVENEGVYYHEGDDVEKATHTMDTAFHFYKMPVNDFVLIKKGIEYDINFGKLKPIKTSIAVNGAYMFTESYNTLETYSRVYEDYLGKSFPYLSVFPAGDKTIRQRFNTNIRTITHIPDIKMIFTINTQIIWFEKKQYKYEENGHSYVYVTKDKQKIDVDNVYAYQGDGVVKNIVPKGYLDKTGNYCDWDPDLYLTQPYYDMVLTRSDYYYLQESYPVAVQFDLKVTKEFANNFTASFTANNFLHIRPYQKLKRSSGYVRRNTPMYFGAEFKMKF